MAAAIAAERIKAATGRSQEYANNVAVDCIVDLINAGYSIIPKKPG